MANRPMVLCNDCGTGLHIHVMSGIHTTRATHRRPAIHQVSRMDQHAAERPLQACWRVCATAMLSSMLVLHPAAVMADDRHSDGQPGDVPQDLRASDVRAPSLGKLVNGPKKEQITNCTRKCLPACIRGGEGTPGLGPLTVRKELIKFKEGFRTRAYCLSECTQVCAASITGVPAAPVGKDD